MSTMIRAVVLVLVVATSVDCKIASAQLPKSSGQFVTVSSMVSPLAHQAAATDETFVYAVDSGRIAKYERATGRELDRSSGEAQHLNSGFLDAGKLYCAHSNYPRTPHQSDIRILDPETMKLEVFHKFADPPGSLTFAVKREGHWWCLFAHYGTQNAKSVLIRFDNDWREDARWTFPKALVDDWGGYSLSGGVFLGDELLATGHDKKAVYRLKIPNKSGVIEVIDVIPSPFPGQGIAVDPKTGGLVGIDRERRKVIFAKFEMK